MDVGVIVGVRVGKAVTAARTAAITVASISGAGVKVGVGTASLTAACTVASISGVGAVFDVTAYDGRWTTVKPLFGGSDPTVSSTNLAHGRRAPGTQGPSLLPSGGGPVLPRPPMRQFVATGGVCSR